MYLPSVSFIVLQHRPEGLLSLGMSNVEMSEDIRSSLEGHSTVATGPVDDVVWKLLKVDHCGGDALHPDPTVATEGFRVIFSQNG